jgi:antirestriction protein ArdC
MTTTKAAPKKSGRVTPAKPRKDLYQSVVDRICALSLQAKKLIWLQEWKAADGGSLFPRSVSTGKLYRGINVWLLLGEALEQGYKSSFWATYDEWARQAGAVNMAAKGEKARWVHPEGLDFGVRKGERCTKVIWWGSFIKEEEDPKTGKVRKVKIRFPKEFNVWNQDQVHQGTLPAKFQPSEAPEVPEFDAIEAAQAIADGYTEVEVRHGGNRAYYRPSADFIGMPEPSAFNTPEAYYSTLFHEMGHSTGHASRLARKDLMESHSFGDTSYSKEELTAEMTAAMLCGIAGIENATIDNSAAYLQSWLSKLQSEPKWLMQAASQAQYAADWVQGIRWTKDGESDGEGAKERPEEVVAA